MASDDDYAAFLERANEDPAKGTSSAAGAAASSSGKKAGGFRTTEAGVDVPPPLVRACRDAFYVSDADEPFQAVALGWDEGGKGLPDPGEFFAFGVLSFGGLANVFVRRGVCGVDWALGPEECGRGDFGSGRLGLQWAVCGGGGRGEGGWGGERCEGVSGCERQRQGRVLGRDDRGEGEGRQAGRCEGAVGGELDGSFSERVC